MTITALPHPTLLLHISAWRTIPQRCSGEFTSAVSLGWWDIHVKVTLDGGRGETGFTGDLADAQAFGPEVVNDVELLVVHFLGTAKRFKRQSGCAGGRVENVRIIEKTSLSNRSITPATFLMIRTLSTTSPYASRSTGGGRFTAQHGAARYSTGCRSACTTNRNQYPRPELRGRTSTQRKVPSKR